MSRQTTQSINVRRCLSALLAMVVLAQSMMTVADPHRLYQPQNGHLEAGHAHAFELLGDGGIPLPLDEHDTHGHVGDKSHDHDHCCHCHGSLSLFVLLELTLPAIPVQIGHSIYGFPALTHSPARLSRPPIS